MYLLVASVLTLASVQRQNAADSLPIVVSYLSSDTSVATVSASGLVSGVAPGLAMLTATSEGKSGSALVTVVPPSSPGPSIWRILEDGVLVTCTVILPCPEVLRRVVDEYRWRTRRRIGFLLLDLLAVLAALAYVTRTGGPLPVDRERQMREHYLTGLNTPVVPSQQVSWPSWGQSLTAPPAARTRS